MKITCILENNACREGLQCRHGLSLLAEAGGHVILSDFGPDGSFAENARALGIDLEAVDMAVLSHGHHDHGDGIGDFFALNGKAPLYAAESAFEPHFAHHPSKEGPEEIGVAGAAEIEKLDRVIKVGGTLKIDESVVLFSGISGKELVSETNGVLKEMKDGELVCDSFRHEQNMALFEDGKAVLIAGCAHTGIVNIMERFIELFGRQPDVAVSGFHLTAPGGAAGYSAVTEELGRRLCSYNTKFYTCHCTGEAAYGVLKDIMGDRLEYFSGGTVIEI